MSKTYVVTGATGFVGKAVVEILEAQDHEVHPVSRRAGVSIDDAATLKRAFGGVDGAFLMIPFDMKAPDLHKRENEIGIKLADAVTAAGVRRVVFLKQHECAPQGTRGQRNECVPHGGTTQWLGDSRAGPLAWLFFMENFLNRNWKQLFRTTVEWLFSNIRGSEGRPQILLNDHK